MFKRIFTALGYVFGTVFVVGLTIALVAYGSGYSYNFKNGKVVRTGLIILQSVPSGLPVTLDGKVTKKRTPYRVSVEAGQHLVQLSRDGYSGWQKRLSVVASEVTTAQYIYMIPNDPKVSVLDTKPQVVAQALSENRRRLAYATAGADPGLFILDLNDANARPVRLYTPLAATATDPAETLSALQWSNDSSRLLVQSSLGPNTLHRLFQPGSDVAPVNLTTQYGFSFAGARFAQTNSRLIYWLSPDGLRRLDLGNQTVSAVLAADVTQFDIGTRDRVLYVQSTGVGRSLWSIDQSGDKQELVQALPDSPSYSIAAATYDGGDQLAIVPAATGIGTLYDDVYGDNPTSRVIARAVKTADFSPDGHLLIFTGNGLMRTYDLERSQVDNRPITYDFPPNGDVQAWKWFDNFHVLMTRGDRLVWSEFDGANQVDLGPAVAGLPGYGSSDLRSVVAYRPSADGSVRLIRIVTRP